MKTSSAKAKGRRAAQQLAEALVIAFTELGGDDVIVTPSGVTGEDLTLSPKARELIPFAFEVKNQEALNIWDALKQAEQHSLEKARVSVNAKPAVAFRRNRSKMYVAIGVEDFIDLLRAARQRAMDDRFLC